MNISEFRSAYLFCESPFLQSERPRPTKEQSSLANCFVSRFFCDYGWNECNQSAVLISLKGSGRKHKAGTKRGRKPNTGCKTDSFVRRIDGRTCGVLKSAGVNNTVLKQGRHGLGQMVRGKQWFFFLSEDQALQFFSFRTLLGWLT